MGWNFDVPVECLCAVPHPYICYILLVFVCKRVWVCIWNGSNKCQFKKLTHKKTTKEKNWRHTEKREVSQSSYILQQQRNQQKQQKVE